MSTLRKLQCACLTDNGNAHIRSDPTKFSEISMKARPLSKSRWFWFFWAKGNDHECGLDVQSRWWPSKRCYDKC